MEYESSATKLDLRFIPDDMTFDESPKEVCTQLPDMSKYQPRFFTTTALQQAKVDLTWDETDPDRLELTQKLSKNKLEEIDDSALHKFVAMSSESESEADEENTETKPTIEKPKGKVKDKDAIDKYRALLLNLEQEEEADEKNDIEMEFEWKPELKEKAEDLVKKRLNENEEDKNPFEKYLEKRKEKRKEKKKLKKNNKDDEDSDFPSDIDMDDPYFAEEFKSDEFKKPQSKTSKRKSRNLREETEEDVEKKKELELLLLDEDSNDDKHFNFDQIQKAESQKDKKKGKKKGKKGKDQEAAKDDFEINVKDDRFQALFTSHQFNIDPTDPQFKKTKSMQKIIDEKLKRKADVEEEVNDFNSAKRSKAELKALVKSVKNKAQSFKNK